MQTNEITGKIIDACVKIHQKLGPGLLESVYEQVLAIELRKQGLRVETEKFLPIIYEDHRIENAYRMDLVVEGSVIVELKSTSQMLPVYGKQLKTYLALSGLEVGILANFGMPTMKEGLKRIILTRNSVCSVPSV